MQEKLQIRIHGDSTLPTLIYLPGLHGDWTLASSFKTAIAGEMRFVEFTYPRTFTWSLQDYANAVLDELRKNNISSGWLLGESFGSQLVWPLVSSASKDFRIQGIILAGGFVRYPVMATARAAFILFRHLPDFVLTQLLRVYAFYARFRHKKASETLESIDEFVQRRKHPNDRKAIEQRYRLILGNDPREIARKCNVPIYHLSGHFDPIVPRWLVRLWLKRNCPSYTASKTIFLADHNVLGTAPAKAAECIFGWVKNLERSSKEQSCTRAE